MNPIAKRVITALSVAAAVVCAVIYAPVWAVAAAVFALWLLAELELGQLLTRRLAPTSFAFFLAFAVGSTVMAAAFSALPIIAARHGNLALLYVLSIVKVSDMGGFAFGLTSAKLMKGGNHKLCPTISPNKSWEGLFGSVFASCLVSCCFAPVTHFAWPKALAMGVAAALVGTFGDLVESKFKRWVGVKDSSTMKITNGMGGVLDMFDSLVFAPTALCPFI